MQKSVKVYELVGRATLYPQRSLCRREIYVLWLQDRPVESMCYLNYKAALAFRSAEEMQRK